MKEIGGNHEETPDSDEGEEVTFEQLWEVIGSFAARIFDSTRNYVRGLEPYETEVGPCVMLVRPDFGFHGPNRHMILSLRRDTETQNFILEHHTGIDSEGSHTCEGEIPVGCYKEVFSQERFEDALSKQGEAEGAYEYASHGFFSNDLVVLSNFDAYMHDPASPLKSEAREILLLFDAEHQGFTDPGFREYTDYIRKRKYYDEGEP